MKFIAFDFIVIGVLAADATITNETDAARREQLFQRFLIEMQELQSPAPTDFDASSLTNPDTPGVRDIFFRMMAVDPLFETRWDEVPPPTMATGCLDQTTFPDRQTFCHPVNPVKKRQDGSFPLFSTPLSAFYLHPPQLRPSAFRTLFGVFTYWGIHLPGWHDLCTHRGKDALMRFALACLLTLTFACCHKVHASNVILSWAPSPSSVVAGYNVYFRTTSGNQLYKVNAGKAASMTISNLIPGLTYRFAVAAYDSFGFEGPHSPEINYLVGYSLAMSSSAVPGSPVTLKFQVVAGHWYEVQASTDLKTWTSIWQSAPAPSSFPASFTDPNAGSYPSRYYRLVIHEALSSKF